MDDRDLDFGLALADQLDELLEDEDGKSADGGREDGAMSYANGLGGGEGSTLAWEDDDDSKRTTFAKKGFEIAFREIYQEFLTLSKVNQAFLFSGLG